MFLKLLFSLGFLLLPCNEDDLVQYYIDLIRQESSRAYNIELPTSASEYQPTSDDVSDCGTFDHIVIGAGSAGAVAASRLSEDSFRKVLLLEAGGDGSDFVDIPSVSPFLLGLEYNWNYDTVPQTNACLGIVENRCRFHQGKGLGGSSLVNTLMYARGNKQDYDNWFDQGNTGWSYADVLPYFKKSEKFLRGDPEYRGTKGYLNVEVFEPIGPQAKAFFDGNKKLGYKLIDYNGIEQIGYGKVQLNILKGKRQSTYHAFLKPFKNRNNLNVLKNAYVTKILIDDNKRAYGVMYNRNGKICKVISKQDIVLSAGAIGSPQILLLSGVGPKSHLEELGIPIVQDLKVGKNLVDHFVLSNTEFTSNYTEVGMDFETKLRQFVKGKGVFSNGINAHGLSFYQTKMEKISNYPDIEMMMVPSPVNYKISNKFYNYKEDTYKAVTKNSNELQNFQLLILGLHPKSSGTVELMSKDWKDYPKIDLNFLSDAEEVDLNTMYEGVQLMFKLINTEGFNKLDVKLKYIPIPACDHNEYLSKEYWFCRIKFFGNPGYHPVGTCKMGSDPSLGAVVDPELKVYGISNLRVADTSIFPLITSGHTSAPAMMIGERVADFVKNVK